MNIPVKIKQNGHHPVLNDQVFKGVDFELQSELYTRLQETVQDPALRIMENISAIAKDFTEFQSDCIKCLLNQREKLSEDIMSLITVCGKVAEDRKESNYRYRNCP
jgi:hypothetical protein